MDHALAWPQRGKWLVSRDAEYNSQMENHIWDLVYLPNGKKAIQCKWLAKIKTDEKGEPSVYKSRLVAKGFQQKEKEDYKEVFAPTAKSPTLRVLLAVAAVRKWKVKQMDIVTAFLKGAIAMARNAVLHGLNKHVKIKWHWLRKEVKLGTLDPIYVKTQQQPADFLTKRLAEEPHWHCARMAGMSLN
ncbi:hypothetical protein CLOP_g7843 [Closterium sp. NIES-67]|nr:hypothetical protein CLOP_g7843 [Closterium sp. NIES-67]